MPSDTFQIGREADKWNHHPGEVLLNPLFHWPIRPMAVLRWYAAYWFAISTTTVTISFAVFVFYAFLPPLDAMQEWHWAWVLRVYLANLIPHCLCAGLLHIWLYKWRAQEKWFKFDPRDQAKNNGTFTFRNQIHDNMFWTIASGITLWTVFLEPFLWAMANGYAPTVLSPKTPFGFF